MEKLTLYSTFAIIIITFLSGCQQEPETQNRTITPIEIEIPEMFADFERHGLQVPWQIESLPDGKIAVLDMRSNGVLIIDRDGQLVNSFGNTGRGPGEFLRAEALQKTGDHLYVIDSDLFRINRFSLSGEFKQSHTIGTRQGVTALDEESYFDRAMGKDGHLIQKVNKEDNSTHLFGEAPGEEEQRRDLDREKTILARGEIPDSFKNTITMYYSDPYLYVFLDTISRLQKYTGDGDLVWDRPVELPENELIFNRIVERANAPGPPGAVPSYRYITSMKVIDGHTYLFWSPVANHPRKLVKVDSNGTIDAIYHIPEEEPTYFDFSIDTDNNLLYLSSPELGEIHRASFLR